MHSEDQVPVIAPIDALRQNLERDTEQEEISMRNLMCSLPKRLSVLCLMALVMIVAPDVSGAESPVAHVDQFQGEVAITRGGAPIEVTAGTPLMTADAITTASNGAIGLRFVDETTIALGPDSQMTLQEYVFAPEQSKFAFVVSIFKGSASYVSGLIAKLSPESTRIVTPSASIGVRGTKFAIEVDPR